MNCVVIFIVIFSIIRCFILGIFHGHWISEFVTSLLLLPLFDLWYFISPLKVLEPLLLKLLQYLLL